MDIAAIKKGEIKYLKRAALWGADLRGADLRKAVLLEANLKKAGLCRADLQEADLEKADLRKANLQWANLQEANLRRANLQDARLGQVNFRAANLKGADLRRTSLQRADLREADLRGADLRGAILLKANLQESNLSNAQLPRTIDWLTTNLEQTSAGWIVYKRIGYTTYATPDYWTIEPGAVLNENCDNSRVLPCSYGVNFGTREWCEDNYEEARLWKCLIRWPWAAGICVPYNSSGKARCERLELVEPIIN